VNLFTVTAAAATIIDVVAEFILCDAGVAGLNFGTAGGSDGRIGYLALDGYASNALVPIGLYSFT